MSSADVILAAIRAALLAVEGTDRRLLNKDWEAPAMAVVRGLTAEAGITWDFTTWTETADLVEAVSGQWAFLWSEDECECGRPAVAFGAAAVRNGVNQ